MNSQKPKILYISHTSEMHGSGRALLNITGQMALKGFEVYIILPQAKGKLYEEIKKRQIKFFIQPVVSWVWPRLKTRRDYVLFPYKFLRILLKSVIFQKELSAITKKIKPDIIHTNVGPVHISHYIAKKLHISHVWHIREYQDLDFGWKQFPTKRKFLKTILDPNNYPIAITRGVFDHHNLTANAKVIYDGVFDTTVVPAIKPIKKNYFLFVGLVSEGKGTAEAIKAFLSTAPHYQKYELWIAGGGSIAYIDELKKLALQSNCSDRVKFLGHRTDVYYLMSEALALIVPSKFEGFGFITAEAMFNGCLVVGKNTAGTKEQFDNGLAMHGEEIGIRYHTEEQLTSAMKSVCETGISPYLHTLKIAQQTVVKLYSSNKNATEISNFYKEILAKHEQ
jgi:glycosyltransferase involved in cell wall biosynthesis